jgi:hypothetical protein
MAWHREARAFRVSASQIDEAAAKMMAKDPLLGDSIATIATQTAL